MPPQEKPKPPGWRPDGQGGAIGKISASDDSPSRYRAQLRCDARFRHLVCRLHTLGPRPVGELLAELGRDHRINSEIVTKLEAYSRHDPLVVACLGGRCWPRVPLELVR